MGGYDLPEGTVFCLFLRSGVAVLELRFFGKLSGIVGGLALLLVSSMLAAAFTVLRLERPEFLLLEPKVLMGIVWEGMLVFRDLGRLELGGLMGGGLELSSCDCF